MAVKMNFTRHAVSRFKERMGKLVQEEGGNALLAFSKQFYSATSDRSFKNNTRFTVALYEKYGYEGEFDFRVTDEVVFVCRGNSVLTCYPKRDSRFEDSRRSRFKK